MIETEINYNIDVFIWSKWLKKKTLTDFMSHSAKSHSINYYGEKMARKMNVFLFFVLKFCDDNFRYFTASHYIAVIADTVQPKQSTGIIVVVKNNER